MIHRCLNYLVNELKKFKYNAIIRLLMEFHLDICLFSLVNLIKINMVSRYIVVSNIFSFVFFVILPPFNLPQVASAASPGLCLWFLTKYKSRLQEEYFKQRFDTLWDGIDVDRTTSRNYSTFFLLRRVFYSMIIVFPEQLFVTQLVLNVVHCLAVRVEV